MLSSHSVKGWRLGSAVVGLLTAAWLFVGIGPAAASEGYDIASHATPLLPDGSTLGNVSDVEATTAEMSDAGSGPCPTESHPEGYRHALILATTASVNSRLDLSVADDLPDSLSLCAVDLYRADSDPARFQDPFDSDQRTQFLAGRTSDCATTGSCALQATLTAGKDYYLVFWTEPPRSDGQATDAGFHYSASVRRPAAVSLAISGQRIVDRGWNEVIADRWFTVAANVPGAEGIVRFNYERWTGSAWIQLAHYDAPLSSGAGRVRLKAASSGLHRVRGSFPGTDRLLPGTSAPAMIKFVTVSWTRYSDGGVKLTVPWQHQQYRLTCEERSLGMALAWYGINQSDLQILSRVGVDGRPRSGGRWGDPNRAFVGSYNGRMGSTGYGVHAGPIARAATSYRPSRPAIAFSGASFATIARYLNDGFPVVMWGAHPGTTGVYRMQWTSWEGRLVTAYSVEHTWTIVGFRGSPSNPTAFIVHNPSGAAAATVPVSTVYAFTRYFDNAGVAVR
jgi:uncharacterized protein YvpB